MLIRIVAALVFMLALSVGGRAEAASGCPLPFILPNGVIPDANQVMANLYTLQACVGGGGTPINLGLTVPPEFAVTGSPYTGGSGVFAVGKASENPNTVWAGPVAGTPQPPTFRQLSCADLAGGCQVAGIINTPCNGIVDDTSAINNALSRGGMAVLPLGTCSISAPLNVTVAGTVLQGQGQYSTTITPTAPMAEAINIAVQSTIRNLGVSDLVHNATHLIRHIAGDVSSEHLTFIDNVFLVCNASSFTPGSDGIYIDAEGRDLYMRAIVSAGCQHAFHVGNNGVNSAITDSSLIFGGILLEQLGDQEPEGIRIANTVVFTLGAGPAVEIRSGETFYIEHDILDQLRGSDNCVLLNQVGAQLQEINISDTWCGYTGTGAADQIRIVGDVRYVKIKGVMLDGDHGTGVNIVNNASGVSLSQVSTRNPQPAQTDVNLGNAADLVTIVAPAFHSAVGIASSGGSFCRLGGTITGTIAGASSCP